MGEETLNKVQGSRREVFRILQSLIKSFRVLVTSGPLGLCDRFELWRSLDFAV